MLAQTEEDTVVIVGCHDIPVTPFARDSRVQFIPVTFSPPTRNNDDMCVDKVLKLSAGAEWAIAHGCDYIIFSDADDLVSNRVGTFIYEHRGEYGWYCNTEMFYTYGGCLLRFCKISGKSAGPCVIVRSDLLSFSQPPFSGTWTDMLRLGGESQYLRMLERHGLRTNILAAVGLGNYRQLMEIDGYPLSPLPFPANIVINHADSTSSVPGGVGSRDIGQSNRNPAWRLFLSQMKSSAIKITTFTPITRTRRAEFSVPDDSEIPLQYKKGGSIFWR